MRTFAFIIFTFLVVNLQAQFWLPTADRAKLVEGRILLVEESDFVCNSNILAHLKKHWKLNSEIKGMSASEIDGLLTPENASKYIVLTGDAHQEYHTVQGKNIYAEVQSITLYPGEHAMGRNESELGREWIVKMGLPTCLVSEQEVMLLSAFLEKYILEMKDKPNSKNKKKSKIPPASTKLLKTKTLLIPTDICEAEENAITKYYKSPYKMASRDEIKSAIDQKDSDKAYLTVLWSDKHFMWALCAVDCATNEVLAVAKFDGYKPNFTKSSFDSGADFLSVYRSKSKVNISVIKYLAKAIIKAETAR